MTDIAPEERSPRAAEYVLRLLSPAEESEFEAAMRADAAVTAEVARWVTQFEDMNAGFAEVSPPASAKRGLMERLFEDAVPVRVPFWQRVWLWQGVSFAALALAAFVGFNALSGTERPIFVTEIAAEDNSLRLLAVFDPATDALKITRTAGAAPQGRVLELWAISGSAAPVSLGVLPDQDTATVPVPEVYRSAGGLTLAISEEPPGGSPTGSPTGAVLAVGQAQDI